MRKFKKLQKVRINDMGIIFTKLTMNNFKPYKSATTLEFSINKPVTVIYGENMTGKTTIMDAVKWVWYGHTQDRHGTVLTNKKLINSEYFSEGYYVSSVTLHFYTDENNYQLHRQIQAKNSFIEPISNNDFEENVYLSENGNQLKADEIQIKLNDLMPESISQFFLFDGERLNAYEELIQDESKQSSEIKLSIEKILGIPAIENAILDCASNFNEANKRLIDSSQKDEAAKKASTRAQQISVLRDNAQSQVDTLIVQKEQLLSELSDVEQKLDAMAGAEKDVQQIEKLNLQIAGCKTNIADSLSNLKNIMENSWKDLLHKKAQEKIQTLKNEKDKIQETKLEKYKIETQITQLEMSLATSVCETCKQSLSDDDLKSGKDKLAQTKWDLEYISYDPENEQRLIFELNILENINPPNAALAIKNCEQTELTNIASMYSFESEKQKFENALKNHDQIDIKLNRSQKESIDKQILLLDLDLAKEKEEVAKLTEEAYKLSNEISNFNLPALQRITHEVKLYRDLRMTFQNALNLFRDKAKNEVENSASKAFLNMTTDKTYKGLSINNNYGLDILLSNGDVAPSRAAGAEQIVALSLISALNQNAVKNGPIIMDTPFGRLDKTHRDNVLNHLSTSTKQIVLLVHSGEMSPGEEIKEIQQYVGKEYKVNHPTSTTSELVSI
jgi:DNA sulfur modification protein DndD